MTRPLVSCLCPTYGRWSRLCESLACFLMQDCSLAELVILNSHKVPIVFEHDRVRVLNRPQETDLGDLCGQLVQEARGEYVTAWTDDDLFLPWMVSQCVEHIGDHDAWKPLRSWFTPDGGRTYQLCPNNMEGSILFRRKDQLEIGYKPGLGDGHQWMLERLTVAWEEMGPWAGYVFVWGCGLWKASGSMGQPDLQARLRNWRAANRDTGRGKPLVPRFADVRAKFARMSEFVPEDVRAAWVERAMVNPHQ
jgi:glycosyl transferase family 2